MLKHSLINLIRVQASCLSYHIHMTCVYTHLLRYNKHTNIQSLRRSLRVGRKQVTYMSTISSYNCIHNNQTQSGATLKQVTSATFLFIVRHKKKVILSHFLRISAVRGTQPSVYSSLIGWRIKISKYSLVLSQ